MSSRETAERQGQPVPTGPERDKGGDQTGPYGGDDGAREHEEAEMDAPDTLTPEDTGSKVEPSRKNS